MMITETWSALAKAVDVLRIASDGHPLLQRVTRDESFGGNNKVVPAVDGYGIAGGMGPCWLITRSSDYERVRFTSPEQVVPKLVQAAKAMGDRIALGMYQSYERKNSVAHHGSRDTVDPLCEWVPAYGPRQDDNWKGVNRSADQQRLAGLRLNVSGMPAIEAFHEADARAEREGSYADEPFYMHPDTYAGLAKRDRRLSMVQDEACPRSVVWRLPDNHLSLVSCGAMPHLSNFDGNVVLQTETPGEYEARICFYGNTVLRNPGHVVRMMGLELQKKVSVQVPSNYVCSTANVATGDIVITPQSRSLNWNPLGAVPTITAQPMVPAVTERACPNPTCGKMNDAVGVKRCWNCESAL